MLKPFEQTVKREKAKRIFVRGMDDFLFVSTDILEAEWFLAKIRSPLDGGNVQIQDKKTLSNVYAKPDQHLVTNQEKYAELDLSTKEFNRELKIHPNMRCGDDKEVLFCGTIFNMRTYECRPDFSSLFEKKIIFSMKLNLWRERTDAVEFITKKMAFVSGLKIERLFLTHSVNSVENSTANLYEAIFVTCLRFHALMATFFKMFEGLTTSDVMKIVQKMKITARTKVLRALKIPKLSEEETIIRKLETLSFHQFDWIFYHALRRTIQRSASVYFKTDLFKMTKKNFQHADSKLSFETKAILKKATYKIAKEFRNTESILTEPYFRL